MKRHHHTVEYYAKLWCTDKLHDDQCNLLSCNSMRMVVKYDDESSSLVSLKVVVIDLYFATDSLRPNRILLKLKDLFYRTTYTFWYITKGSKFTQNYLKFGEIHCSQTYKLEKMDPCVNYFIYIFIAIKKFI